MSLKLRLVLIPSVILTLGLAATIGYELALAPTRVRAEVSSGMRLGRLLIGAALATAERTGSADLALARLRAELPEVRHVVFHIVTSTDQIAASEVPEIDRKRSPAPLWFARLFNLSPKISLFPVLIDGREVARIEMLSNPLDEIAEIWGELRWLCGLLFVSSVAIVGLTLWTVRSALRPVRALQVSFDRLELGDYEVRLPPIPIAELARIGEQFNSLARSLGEVTEDNHRLIDALIKLQEAERKEIAHELHDEFGPVLFGIRAEVASILGSCRRAGAPLAAIAERAAAIGRLVDSVQRTNARILARLRPLTLDQLGLAEALRELVAGWQEHCPEIIFSVRADNVEVRDEGAGLALYRVVQECLTNAARHAGARQVEVRLEQMNSRRRTVRVLVCDDGRGLPSGFRFGFGLLGMSERVRALNGHLSIGNRSSGGTEIAVTMDLPATAAL